MMTKRIVVGPMRGVVAMGAAGMVGVVGVGAVLLWTGCAQQADPNPSALEAAASDASQAGDTDQSVREVDAQPSVSAAEAAPVHVEPIEVESNGVELVALESAGLEPLAIELEVNESAVVEPVDVNLVAIEPVDERVSNEPSADAPPTDPAATPARAPLQTNRVVSAASHVAIDFRGVIGIDVQGEASVRAQPQPSSDQPGARPTVVVGVPDIAIDPETGFASAAFPPTLTDQKWHQDAWQINNCLDCHETGVGDAIPIRHTGLPAITLASSCRTCHTIAPGKLEPSIHLAPTLFAANAFPPMLPNNNNHKDAWGKNNCLLCHENGVRGAPVVRHEGMARLLLDAKCRTCHVQVRSHEALPLAG